MFYRLIKPIWAKKYKANGEKNPEFVRDLTGEPNTYEGCFSREFIEEKNKLGFNVYYFPNHPSTNVYEQGIRHLSGKHIDTFNFVFVDMDLKDGIYKDSREHTEGDHIGQ